MCAARVCASRGEKAERWECGGGGGGGEEEEHVRCKAAERGLVGEGDARRHGKKERVSKRESL